MKTCSITVTTVMLYTKQIFNFLQQKKKEFPDKITTK